MESRITIHEEVFMETMPENGLQLCCESDCKWKTFVITGQLDRKMTYKNEVENSHKIFAKVHVR